MDSSLIKSIIASGLMLFGCMSASFASPTVLNVDTGKTIRQNVNHWIGIDLNYIRDNDVNRPEARPLVNALKKMGVKWLRYPGGEKSDFQLFAKPPYTHADPVSLGWYASVKSVRMNFDEYIAYCRKTGAEPFVVVGCDNQKRTGLTWDQWLKNAVEWVRYANIVKHYHVKYWEIGNENWANNTAAPEDMAAIVTRFSKAMKAVDPSIHIGASASGWDGWVRPFLAGASKSVDFLTVSVYNTYGWGGYDYVLRHPETDLSQWGGDVARLIQQFAPPEDRDRIKVIVTETNSKDYSTDHPWPGDNTLGHAIITFETFGALMKNKSIMAAMLWTTRWMNDDEAPRSQWYALDAQNHLLPSGRAVEMWGAFLHDELIDVRGENNTLQAYASRSKDGKKLSVWVVNRDYQPANDVAVKIQSSRSYQVTSVHQFTGTGPDDENPTWKALRAIKMKDSKLKVLSFPGLSVTIFSLSGV